MPHIRSWAFYRQHLLALTEGLEGKGMGRVSLYTSKRGTPPIQTQHDDPEPQEIFHTLVRNGKKKI